MSSIHINLWLQSAIEFKVEEHVRNLIQKRDNLGESVFIEIHETWSSGGFIDVKWSYQANNRAPTTRKTGIESFTLAEVLRICMMDEKEKVEKEEGKTHPKELNTKYKIGEKVVFSPTVFRRR